MNIQTIAPMAVRYDSYRYLWPPRPELKLTADKLPTFDDGRFVAQPKLNGANVLAFIKETESQVMNRHNENKTGSINVDFRSLHRGTGYMVLNGEWMEKSKKDENGNNFNQHFVLFDILVYDGWILSGSTAADRIRLMKDLYGNEQHSKFLYQTGVPNVVRVKTYAGNFQSLYNQLVPIDMYEGVVLKRRDAILNHPFSQSANTKWLIKARKETKIYKF